MNTTTISEPLTSEKLDKLIDVLKPKKIIVTSDTKLYNKLIKLPYMNERNIKLSQWVEGTYIIDMEKLLDIVY